MAMLGSNPYQMTINFKTTNMKYYQCKFTAIGGAYSMDMYDLTTDDEVEIKEILEDQGYEVLEIYSIKQQ